MLYRLIVPLLIRGDRVERGTEIELSEEQAARFDPADIAPVSGEIVIEAEATEVVPLEDMTSAQLKTRARELGLSAGGSAADIRERIELHLVGNTEGEKPEGETGEGETEGEKPEGETGEGETEGEKPEGEITND